MDYSAEALSPASVIVYSRGVTNAAVLKRVSTDLTRQEIGNQDADTAEVVRDKGLSVVRTFELEASAFHGEQRSTSGTSGSARPG